MLKKDALRASFFFIKRLQINWPFVKINETKQTR